MNESKILEIIDVQLEQMEAVIAPSKVVSDAGFCGARALLRLSAKGDFPVPPVIPVLIESRNRYQYSNDAIAFIVSVRGHLDGELAEAALRSVPDLLRAKGWDVLTDTWKERPVPHVEICIWLSPLPTVTP